MKLVCLDNNNCGHVEFFSDTEASSEDSAAKSFICAACYGTALPFSNSYIPSEDSTPNLEPIVPQETTKEKIKEKDQ